MMDFYEILGQIMEEKKMSIADVARACKLTDSTVRSIFDRHQKKVALNVAFKLADGLDVSLERLNGQPDAATKNSSDFSKEAKGIGKRIKEAREQLGLTQEELGSLVGVTGSAITNYEKGTSHPKEPVMYALIDALGVDANFLFQDCVKTKTAPSISDGAMKLAKDYDTLDNHGRSAVRGLMDEELNRMEELAALAELAPENEPKIINLFDNPSAAGPALVETGQGCQPYELKADDPQGASYAVRVQGDSMEPDFPDGSIAFVNHDEMRDGDIGVFCVDGATVIKQYHYDAMLGMTYLFSLNRKRADADLLITPSGNRTLVWQGRVITKRRYPLPGM